MPDHQILHLRHDGLSNGFFVEQVPCHHVAMTTTLDSPILNTVSWGLLALVSPSDYCRQAARISCIRVIYSEGESLMSNSNDDRRPTQQDQGEKGSHWQEQQDGGKGKSSSGQQGGHQSHTGVQQG